MIEGVARPVFSSGVSQICTVCCGILGCILGAGEEFGIFLYGADTGGESSTSLSQLRL